MNYSSFLQEGGVKQILPFLCFPTRRVFSTQSQHTEEEEEEEEEDVYKWKNKDYDKVLNWSKCYIDEQHANKLKVQEIDGPALIEMAKNTQQELRTIFLSGPYNFPDGPATKLASAIKALSGQALQQGIDHSILLLCSSNCNLTAQVYLLSLEISKLSP